MKINIWAELVRYTIMVIGVIIGAISVVLFMLPYEITPTGATGVSVLLNHFLGTPVGVMIIVLNIPIQYIGYRMLPGGWQMIFQTAFVLVIYGFAMDVIAPMVPDGGVSNDRLLNAIFGGVLSGISIGFVYRTGGSWGGSSTLALILQRKTGTPMSTTFLYIDMGIIVAAGLIFGWEPALYATIVLFISGVAADYVMEGPSVIRTAVIVTDKPQEVADGIIEHLRRGVSGWDVKGMYTGQTRHMLYVSIARSQVHELKEVVLQRDPKAFVVIGQGHMAYGEGFKPLNGKRTA